ncbi:MAG TPA: HEAT repeat domain-containing protein, partial [Planctomycetota bacterium]|nr:HEAT repeat domain-containing protein [Planctomycetota bacterium]
IDEVLGARDGQPEAVGRLRQMVTSDLPQIRRECATALGRIGDRSAVSSLLDSMRAGADRFLEHSIIFALIRLGDRESMRAALGEPGSAARRAALVALDQMDGGDLTQDQVTPLLDPVDPALQQAALRVILARPSWAKEILGLAGRWLAEPVLDEGRQETLRGVIVSFAAHPSFQDLLAQSLRDPRTATPTRVLILESMARSPLDHLPPTWLSEARWSLDSPDEKVVRQAVATIRISGSGEFDEALLRLAREDSRSIELRSEALAASTSRLGRLEPGLFGFLLDCLGKDKAPLTRVTAAEALGRSPLDDGQLDSLARAMPGVGPLEMPRLIGVFERSKNAGVGRRLLAALETSPGFQSLSGEGLRKALRNFPEDLRTRAEPLLKKLEVDTAAMKVRLDELAPVLSGGEAGHGRDVFFGKKAGCTACHTVAGTGGKVGPDLSKIGSIRSGRDLLESIVFPSATFARGYEPFLLRTRDGAIYDGLIVRETAEAIVMFTSDRVEKRIPRSSIEEIRQGKVSVMPQGLDAQLTREELRDLIAFLLSLR